MSILLTDEELWDVIKEYNPFSIEQREAVAQAQLRKVAEWLDEPCYDHNRTDPYGMPVPDRRDCPICKIILRREAGVE